MDLLNAMRIFTRVVERSSLSAAGRDLGLAQPTVSERIEKLETHLGVRLLYRTTRSVQATEMGTRFYGHAKRALEAADEAEASVIFSAPLLSGTLRLAAPPSLGEVTLPGLLIEFQRRHPEITIDLTLNGRFVDPMSEGVDLSLRLGAVGNGHFIARRLGAVRRLLLASPDYLRQNGAPQTPDDLTTHRFIRITALAPNERLTLIDPDGRLVEAPIRTHWRVDHWRPLAAALVAGSGIGVLQSVVCVREIAEGRLVPVLPEFKLHDMEAHAIYPSGLHPSARTKAFLALLKERADVLLGCDTAAP